jgi:hypothetical protein
VLKLLPLVLVLGAVVALRPAAGPHGCAVADRSAEEVVPGVTLTWDSSFRCEGLQREGRYRVVVRVSNHAGSAGTVRLEAVRLSHATPRPRGRAPEATVEARGLPLTLGPGARVTLTVRGRVELVDTDEGPKANLHLRVHGEGPGSEPVVLGVNVHLRAPGATGGP